MSYSDDFNSSMNSPGGWGGSSGGGFGSSSGPQSSGSVYGYNTMPGARPNTMSVGNWNTGGSPFATGTAGDIRSMLGGLFGSLGASPQAPVTSGPIPPALGPQGIPTPRALPPATQPVPPSMPRPPGALSWPPGSMGHGSTWGGGAIQPGTAPQGSYTRPPGSSFGMGMSGYGGMGNDFRSNNFSPSSYPGGDGITSNDIGGGWRY